MSPIWLALIWLGLGIAAAMVLPPLRRRRAGWLAPAGAGLAGLAATTVATWPGPGAAVSYGASLSLGRPGLGLLVTAGIGLGVAMVLSPRVDGGEVVTMGVVGAATVVVLSSAVPVVWSAALAIGFGAVAVRWIAGVPGRPTLAAGRIAGLGAAALIGAAAILPGAGLDTGIGLTPDTRAVLAGALLAAGIVALLGLVPAGGWIAASAAVIRGIDLAPWALLLAPAVLLSAAALLPGLPANSHAPLANSLLILGLVSALYGGVQAIRADSGSRYSRVFLADLALAAAGIGGGHPPAQLGAYVVVLTHLCAAPLLLHGDRVGVRRPRRLAWLGLTGLPPSPAFWGRFLILESLAATSGLALAAGIVVTAPMLAAAVRSLVQAGDVDPDAGPSSVPARVLAWTVAIAVVAIGFAPAAITGRVFGVDV